MISLEAKRGALSRGQIAVPADIFGNHGITGSTETDIPAAGYLRRFAETEHDAPATDGTAALIRDGHVQLITGIPDIGMGHCTRNTGTASTRTA